MKLNFALTLIQLKYSLFFLSEQLIILVLTSIPITMAPKGEWSKGFFQNNQIILSEILGHLSRRTGSDNPRPDMKLLVNLTWDTGAISSRKDLLEWVQEEVARLKPSSSSQPSQSSGELVLRPTNTQVTRYQGALPDNTPGDWKVRSFHSTVEESFSAHFWIDCISPG